MNVRAAGSPVAQLSWGHSIAELELAWIQTQQEIARAQPQLASSSDWPLHQFSVEAPIPDHDPMGNNLR